MKEIQPNVYWLEGRAVNLYLCVDSDGLTLVDAGMPKSEGLVLTAVSELGFQPTDLKRILITHADLDHAGSMAAVQAATGAVVFASAESAVYLQNGRSPKHLPWLVQTLSDAFFKYKPLSAARLQTFRAGDVLPVLGGLEVLATPGHTRDHHSLYHPSSGLLFAGDALNTRDGRLQSTPKRITADKEAARQSVIQLLEKKPTVFACGHGAPLADNGGKNGQQLLLELRQS
ncbi:MAG: MBL fold metallo-hydrolase [Chloroflexi bacterium]|nr:MBL fold metallo-hydrolase [Chloroflexota bacterium]MBK6710930.1 MBL fold metallo-hydrolase [Chloroflexota bacterium]MBK7915597.1 MBL fold metallo-hydrolase [Chloroflexota bacterium]MBK8934058.1 MBL fold metallo-hydrolase [Chloroflexota bacterium]MBP6805586.1 MBL fold metallo-hydrolase [Chloroflexota bacterium]